MPLFEDRPSNSASTSLLFSPLTSPVHLLLRVRLNGLLDLPGDPLVLALMLPENTVLPSCCWTSRLLHAAAAAQLGMTSTWSPADWHCGLATWTSLREALRQEVLLAQLHPVDPLLLVVDQRRPALQLLI